MKKTAVVAFLALVPMATFAEEACVDLAMCNSHIGKLEKKVSELERVVKELKSEFEGLSNKFVTLENFAEFERGFDGVQENDLHRQGNVGMSEEVRSQGQNFGGEQCPAGQYLAGLNFWGRNLKMFDKHDPAVTGFSGADFYCRPIRVKQNN